MNWTAERFRQFGQRWIAVHDSGALTYADFVREIERWRRALRTWGIAAGDRVALVSDHHIDAVALLQALVDEGCIVIPLSEDDRGSFDERLRTACATKTRHRRSPRRDRPDATECRDVARDDEGMHPLLLDMTTRGRPGFVIFTSGSTGKGKAVLLDHARMTQKYRGTGARGSFARCCS